MTADIVFQAIANPARREIISRLAASSQTVKELTSAFDMSQPAVSQHLRSLKAAKLVCSERNGSHQTYRLTGEPLKAVFDWCSKYRSFFDPGGHAWAFVETKSRKGSQNGD